MKTFIIDTNVILDSVDNIYKLSDNGANLIVIPEVVIDELDSKKSGFEEINFNARQFARLLEEGEITSKFNVENMALAIAGHDGNEFGLIGIAFRFARSGKQQCQSHHYG